MELTLKDRSSFCSKLLKPVSLISDLVILDVESNRVSSLCKTADNYTILYASTTDISSSVSSKKSLNIADIKKFIRAFDCIEANDITVKLNGNNIEYKSSKTKFKFHLLEDGIIAPITSKLEKIEKFKYDVSFKLLVSSFTNLLKSSTFITDSNCKVYIYTEGGNVYADLTDRVRHNVDSYCTLISEEFSGNEIIDAIPFPLETFRSISTIKSVELNVQINTEIGVLCVDVEDSNYKLKYISSAMAS